MENGRDFLPRHGLKLPFVRRFRMKTYKGAENIAPITAVISALASLACCLPWGIAGLLGTLGIGVALEKHRLWLIALSVILLAFGGYSLIQTNRSCRRVRPGPMILIVVCMI